MRWILIAVLFFACNNEHHQLFTAFIDSYVDEDTPAANYGDVATLNAGLGLYPRQQRIYIKFDIGELPSDAEIIDATLSLYCVDDYNKNDYKFFVYRALGGWAENLISWENQPGPSDLDFPYAYEMVGGSGEWYNWDITDLVQGWVQGDYLNTGFVIVDEQEQTNSTISTTYKAFSSKEGNRPPELKIKYR